MPAHFHPDDANTTGEGGARQARGLAAVLWAGAGLALLAGGVLLWRDRAELVFLDMVASAFAMCF